MGQQLWSDNHHPTALHTLLVCYANRKSSQALIELTVANAEKKCDTKGPDVNI
ncbi:hypothetical protein KIN20_027599 [Parelaphostrongylus tenuis]|uniref:Uncharacterized protein n=1 Tax=Parelaphostrongylus tenuis TaxID=148309 RepID=A0AAD5QZN9_PARTN|nr:hypothetical protein KIN20_027599 [Parelaphostrongylus tenuis]